MKAKIRNAVPADEERIRALFLEMLQTIYHRENVEGYPDGYLDRYWIGGKDRLYVAEDRDVVAFLSVEVHEEANLYIYLDDLSVTRDYRNQGIGSALIKEAESYATESQIPAVLFHVEKTNLDAYRLYQRLGYVVYRDDGHRYLMKKDIR